MSKLLSKYFFNTYLQFLVGEMVNVLLLDVRSVRVVDHVETVFKIFSVFTYSSCLARWLMYCYLVFGAFVLLASIKSIEKTIVMVTINKFLMMGMVGIP